MIENVWEYQCRDCSFNIAVEATAEVESLNVTPVFIYPDQEPDEVKEHVRDTGHRFDDPRNPHF